jgi:hypothetical protein
MDILQDRALNLATTAAARASAQNAAATLFRPASRNQLKIKSLNPKAVMPATKISP